jgi:hypothetical protein
MFTEKGTLPIGVKYDGKRHKEFEIREQLVADSVDIFDDPARGERAIKNPRYGELCITANMLLNIGTIPKDIITGDLLMLMHQADQNAISAAETRLAIKRSTFREEKEG